MYMMVPFSPYSCLHWYAEFCIQQSVLAFHILKKHVLASEYFLGKQKAGRVIKVPYIGHVLSYQYIVLVPAFSKADCLSISDGCYTSALPKYIGATQE